MIAVMMMMMFAYIIVCIKWMQLTCLLQDGSTTLTAKTFIFKLTIMFLQMYTNAQVLLVTGGVVIDNVHNLASTEVSLSSGKQ